MCRSIKTLRGPEASSDEEIHAAALQFVRKISGYRQPSRANQEAFDRAVTEAGLRLEHRFATWDLRAWHDDADFAVSVLRHM
jgi:hypothetical protein